MTWSGLTKYIRQICVGMSKPIELPGIGILVPTTQMLKKAMLTKDALEKFNEKDLNEIVLLINKKFLDAAEVFIRQRDS